MCLVEKETSWAEWKMNTIFSSLVLYCILIIQPHWEADFISICVCPLNWNGRGTHIKMSVCSSQGSHITLFTKFKWNRKHRKMLNALRLLFLQLWWCAWQDNKSRLVVKSYIWYSIKMSTMWNKTRLSSHWIYSDVKLKLCLEEKLMLFIILFSSLSMRRDGISFNVTSRKPAMDQYMVTALYSSYFTGLINAFIKEQLSSLHVQNE